MDFALPIVIGAVLVIGVLTLICVVGAKPRERYYSPDRHARIRKRR